MHRYGKQTYKIRNLIDSATGEYSKRLLLVERIGIYCRSTILWAYKNFDDAY